MFPTFRARETLTAAWRARLLRTTAAHEKTRDHLLYSAALGTGPRLRELPRLNVGDASPAERRVCPRDTSRVEKWTSRPGVLLT